MGELEQKLAAEWLQDDVGTGLSRAVLLQQPPGAQPVQPAAKRSIDSQFDPPLIWVQEQLRKKQQLEAQPDQLAAQGSVDSQPARQLDRQIDKLPDQLIDDELPDHLLDQLPRLKRTIADPA
jgi:hypothetical protein